MTESTQNNSKCINARVMVFGYACHLMLINIYMKFCENSLNGFQVIELRGLCDGRSSKGNN